MLKGELLGYPSSEPHDFHCETKLLLLKITNVQTLKQICKKCYNDFLPATALRLHADRVLLTVLLLVGIIERSHDSLATIEMLKAVTRNLYV